MREQERNPSARRVRRRGVSGRAVVAAVGVAGALAVAAASPAVASRVHGGGDPAVVRTTHGAVRGTVTGDPGHYQG